MNDRLVDALENCLTALQEGQSLDAALTRYTDLAQELRPLLKASLRARSLSSLAVPNEIQRRGRARLLQRVGELREARQPARPRAIPAFPRLAISLALVFVLVLTSTGLVRASSASLPGDQLYPVKRTWENTRFFFASSAQERDVLESQYQQDRLDETNELLSNGRSAAVSFSGLVTRQQGEQWLVSGIPISVTDSTHLPSGLINSGAPVVVRGVTGPDGTVEADEIQLLQSGASFPPLKPSEDNHPEGKGSTPAVLETPETHEISATPQSYQFSGVVQSMQDGVWSINSQSVSVEQAEIIGDVEVGSYVKFEGYYDSNGQFVVTKIEVKPASKPDSSKGDKSNGDSGNDGDDGGGDSP